MKQFANKYIRNYSSINIFIIILSFLFVFISIDGNIGSQSNFTLFFRRWFVVPRDVLLYLSPFEIILAITVLLLLNFNAKFVSNKMDGTMKFLIWIYLIDAILYIINPNDYFYLYLDKLVILLFIYILFSLNRNLFAAFIIKLAKYITFFFVLKVLILTYFYLTNKNVVYIHTIHSISIEEDFNIFTSLMASLSFAIFLVVRRWPYFFLFGVLVLFQILTFRRSGVFNTLIVSIMLVIISMFYSKKSIIELFKNLSVITFFLLVLVFVFQELMKSSIGMIYLGRFFSAFVDIGITVSNTGYVNDHFEESRFAFYKAIEVLPFWGVGSQSSTLPIRFGNIHGIHNVYVSVWMIYTFGNLLCLISVVFIFLKYSIKTIIQPFNNKTFHFIKLAILFFILIYFFNLWVAPPWNWISTKVQVMILLILSILIRTNDIESYLLKISKYPSNIN